MLASVADLRRYLELGPESDENEIMAALGGIGGEQAQYEVQRAVWFPELSANHGRRVAASLGSTSDGLADFKALGHGMGAIGHV